MPLSPGGMDAPTLSLTYTEEIMNSFECPIWTVKPNSNNRPLSEDRVRWLMQPENEMELYTPIIVNRDGECVSGSHRLEALRRLEVAYVKVCTQTMSERETDQPINRTDT